MECGRVRNDWEWTMNRKTWLLALLLGAGPTTAALAEEPAAALSREQISAMQAENGEAMFSPEALAAILTPAPAGRTRSLAAGTGKAPRPGSTGSGVVPDLQIQFATNSAAISAQAERRLNALATAMQFPQMHDVQLIIAGHTDARGSDAMNKALSQRRADAVVAWLVTERAIDPDRLQAVGYGEERLADRANPASGVNRRVEVITKQVGPSASAY